VRYLRVTSLEEAWSAMQEGGETARVIGGGVDLALFVPRGVKTLVDISGLFRDCVDTPEGGLRIGAGLTLTELAESASVGRYVDGIVVDVLRRVASPLLRNLATVGGTLASAHPWSDVIPLSIALGAEVELYAGEPRRMALEDLVLDRAAMARALITHVHLPAAAPGARAAFEKFTRTGFDVGMLNCACCVVLEDGLCRMARIALGGTPDMAKRVREAEEALRERALDDETIAATAERGAQAVPARDDQRASAEYRRVLAAAGIRRCLERIAAATGGKS